MVSIFRLGRFGMGLMASGLCLLLAIRGLDWTVVAESITGVSSTLLLLALVGFLFDSYLRAVRWRILFANADISIARLFIIQNEGIGLNNLLPIRVFGEATQVMVLTLRDGIGKAYALTIIGMERVIDLAACATIFSIAFFVVPETKIFAWYVWGAVLSTILAIGLVRFLSWGSDSLEFVRRFPFIVDVMTAVRNLEQDRLRLLASYFVSVGYWIITGMVAWIITLSVDMTISPVTATIIIIGAIFFATVVPAAPSAIGTFEFAVVYVLEFFGVEREVGFGYGVIVHAIFFMPPTIIAVIFLPLEGVGISRRNRGEISATVMISDNGQ